MKFARYLQETQTPEWQKAYIDYRGLKKHITAIRRWQEGQAAESALPRGSKVDFQDSPRSSSDDHCISSERQDRARRESFTSGAAGQAATIQAGPSESSRSQTTRSRFGVRRSRPTLLRGNTSPRHTFIITPPTITEIRALLSPQEESFLGALDAELDKIESFCLDREKEMTSRSHLLNEQLQELVYHRELFHEAQEESKRVERFWGIPKTSKRPASRPKGKKTADATRFGYLDPDEYQNAKKTLKKAVVEHYRGLETLHNYRVLNLTGFRKALKKFEKVTRIPLMNAYMTEKVDVSPFASDTTIRSMMNEMESIFANQFVRGDKKRALLRLRAGLLTKTHHFSTFRSGLAVGLAVPAFVSGVYQSFQTDTRDEIPAWDALLFVYAILLVPVIFAILVGTNLLVWARARVNYVFIFELEYRSRLDHREYFELPNFLCCTLCYCFWLSFIRAGAPGMNPIYWPLVWLGLAAVILFNPFTLFFKHSRYWLIRSVGRLLLPGLHHVEFTDFWMGDQFCSLIFPLSNLSLLVCTYSTKFGTDWRNQCGSESRLWPAAFVLAQLPLAIRLIQSVRRYADSGLVTHLINYGSGIAAYLWYFMWRHHGGHGTTFALWVLFNTIYTFYAATWDFLMDWSVLRPRAKYVLLRDELLYSNHVPFYYIAIVANILLRFTWVIYVPTSGPDFYLRSFISALLEICRRALWNFYRLENEHLGNVDQYRVTREVPLPYSLDDIGREIDDDDDGDVHETK